MSDLKKKSKRSAIWTIGGKIGSHAINVIFTAILARLIAPESFGIFATFMIVFTISQSLILPFINKNLILEDEDGRIISASFFVSFAHCSLISLAWWISSSIIASYFGQDELQNLLKYGSILLFISAFANPIKSILEKRIDFKWISVIEFLATVLGQGLLAVILAFQSLEYWALFSGFVFYHSFSLLFFFVKARPHFHQPRLQDFRRIYQDSGSMILGNFANMSAQKGDYFIISKYLGAEELGFYSKAFKLMVLPTTLVSSAFQKVAFPILSSVNDDIDKIRAFYLRLIYLSSLLLFPLSIIMFFLAELIVDILLGPQWSQVVLPFQVLLFAIYFRFSYKIGGIVLSVLREFRTLMFNQFLYASLIIGSAFFLKEFGIVGVSIGVTVAIIINYIILHSLAMMKIGISFFQHVSQMRYSLIISVVFYMSFVALEQIFDGTLLLILKPILAVLLSLVFIYLFKIGTVFLFGENGIWWRDFIKSK